MNFSSLSRCRGVLSHAGNLQLRSMSSVLTRCSSRPQDHRGSLSLASQRWPAKCAFPTFGTNKNGTNKDRVSGITELGEKLDSIEKSEERPSVSPTKSKDEWSPAEVLDWMSGKVFGLALRCRDLWRTTPFDVKLHPFGAADATTTPRLKALGALTSISDFKEIRENGLFYVDKTKLVLDLVNKEESKHVFLSRPRRFGKTLTVSVLENLFLGRKALFTGLYAETHWDWTKKNPVLRFDFSGKKTKAFEIELHEMILDLSSAWSFQNQGRTISSALGKLVEHLSNRYGPCVILVDEYDKPVIDSFDLDPKDIEVVARHNRNMLKSFFETIKSLGGMIRFSFVTGSSRLAKAAMFSGDNARQDVSFEASYDAICGFTETELMPLLVQSELKLKELKAMYNGYQFGGESLVYNPFGVVNAFAQGKIDSYWIKSGSLANSVLKFSNPGEILDILRNFDAKEKITTDKSVVSKSFDLEVLLAKEVPLFDLLLQAGYLTLSITEETWSLVIPNDEVRMNAIPELLRLAIARHPDSSAIAQAFSLAIHTTDMNKLYDEAFKFLRTIAFPRSANESYYRSVLQGAFKLVNGVVCHAEYQNSDGRSDLMLNFNSGRNSEFCQIIIELKLIHPAKDINKDKKKLQSIAGRALEQARKYSVGQGDAMLIAGWVVNQETRTLFDIKEYGDKCHQFEDLRKHGNATN